MIKLAIIWVCFSVIVGAVQNDEYIYNGDTKNCVSLKQNIGEIYNASDVGMNCVVVATETGGVDAGLFLKEDFPYKHPVSTLLIINKLKKLQNDKKFFNKACSSPLFSFHLHHTYLNFFKKTAFNLFLPTVDIFYDAKPSDFVGFKLVLLLVENMDKSTFRGKESFLSVLLLFYESANPEIIQKLQNLDAGAYGLECMLMHLAAAKNYLTAFKMLEKINPECVYIYENYSFWSAFESGSFDVVKYLNVKMNGFDDSQVNWYMNQKLIEPRIFNLPFSNSYFPQTLKSACANGYLNTLKQIVRLNLEPVESLPSCFFIAFKHRRLNILKFLIKLFEGGKYSQIDALKSQAIQKLAPFLENPEKSFDEYLSLDESLKYFFVAISLKNTLKIEPRNQASFVFLNDDEIRLFNMISFASSHELFNEYLKRFSIKNIIYKIDVSSAFLRYLQDNPTLDVELVTFYAIKTATLTCDLHAFRQENLSVLSTSNYLQLLNYVCLNPCFPIFKKLFDPSRVKIDLSEVLKNAVAGGSITIVQTILLAIDIFSARSALQHIATKEISFNMLEFLLSQRLIDLSQIDSSSWLFKEYSPKAQSMVFDFQSKCKQLPFESQGEGVVVYVIDSSVNNEKAMIEKERFRCIDINVADCNDFHDEHGTMVASFIGGKYGLAKKSDIVSVPVIKKQLEYTSTKDLILALNACLTDFASGSYKYALINLSLGQDFSLDLESTLAQVSSTPNIIMVASAGNDSNNACKKSPAAFEHVITVGNVKHSFSEDLKYIERSSNYGSCVDVFAPGESLTGTGTSFSAPRVTGALALAASTGCISSVEQARQFLPFISVRNVQKKYPSTTDMSLMNVFTEKSIEILLNDKLSERLRRLTVRKFSRLLWRRKMHLTHKRPLNLRRAPRIKKSTKKIIKRR